MKIHELKTIQPYFDEVWKCGKPFEVRKNDRDFQHEDLVILKEYDIATNTYSGKEVHAQILYILKSHEGLSDGYVAFGLYVKDWIDPTP